MVGHAEVKKKKMQVILFFAAAVSLIMNASFCLSWSGTGDSTWRVCFAGDVLHVCFLSRVFRVFGVELSQPSVKCSISSLQSVTRQRLWLPPPPVRKCVGTIYKH